MKKILLVSGLLIIAATVSFGQKSKIDAVSSASASAKASGQAGNGTAMLQSGTQVSGQLQSELDAKTAKVGDQVVLKTTQSIKQNGQVVVQKGSRLIGHVTDVQQKAKGNATSKVSVLFDTLQQGGSSLPVNAMITSVVQASSHAAISDDSFGDISGSSSTSSSTRGSAQSSGNSGGGLLGGVGNTVGGVVNSTTQTVGGVTNTAGQTLGSTTQAVGGTLRGIQITQSTDASASGGSTLSLGGGNLHLDKGTTINLSLSQSTSVKTN